jgi:hypothetical protein
MLSSESMSGRPSIPAKDIRGNAANLESFTRRILAVPHSKIQAALDAEKAAKRTSKNASGPASRASGHSPRRGA